MIRTAVPAALLAVALLTSAAPAESATVDQWRRDIDHMVERIGALHPRPWGEIGRVAFLRRVAELKRDLPSLTEAQRTARTMALVALIGDRATQVEPDNPAFNTWYPIRVYAFEDGVHVTAAHRSVADLAGARLIEVGGRPAEEAVALAGGLLAANSPAERRERLYPFHNAGLMQGLGLAETDGRLKVRVRLTSGRVVERLLDPAATQNPAYAASGASPFIWADLPEVYGVPLGAHDEWVTGIQGLPASAFRTADEARTPYLGLRRVFYARPIPDQDAYYVQLNYMSNSAQETFEDFFRRTLADVDVRKPRRLIIDLRFNAGGDGSKGLMMAHEIVRRGPDTPWREVYILIGRRTSGAAMSAIDAFVRNTPTTLVGEPAGGALNGVSDSRSFLYPDLRLRLSVATSLGQMGEATDISESLLPDVPALWTFEDWAAGRDPAVEAILAGQEMRSVGVIARMDGGAAARALDNARRPGFEQHHAWWRPIRFEAVKSAGYGLMRDGRPADAIEVFTLMTEIYPNEWNSWESLGRAQTAAGDAVAARSSYRCALALDPENFDAGDLRAALAQAPAEAPTTPAGCPAPFRA